MNKLLAASGALVSLAVATPALAATISFTDLTEGPPSLSTSGVDVVSAGIGPDSYTFSGRLHIPFGDGVLFTAPYEFALIEPDGSVSDTLLVDTPNGFGGPGAADWVQDISVGFDSQDGQPFPQVQTCVQHEDGTVQTCHLFSQTGADILDIQIQSDVAEGQVPEPSTLALLGLGLAALGFSRRKRA